MFRIFGLFLISILLLSCGGSQKRKNERLKSSQFTITGSEATYPNSKNINKPNEDYFVADKVNHIYLVLDGVSRSKINGIYPNPSPSAEVAHIFGDEVHKKLLEVLDKNKVQTSLQESMEYGNKAVEKYNAKSTEWGFLPGVVGVVSVIIGDSFYYAFAGDCYGRLVREGKMTLFTYPQTKLIHEHKGEFSADEIRNRICNNKNHPYGYGVFTGQAEALDFVEFGSFKILKGDRIVLTSDGMEHLFNSEKFSWTDLFPSDRLIQMAVDLESSDPSLDSDDKAVIQLEIH